MKNLIAFAIFAAFIASVFWNYDIAPAVGDDVNCSGPAVMLSELRCWINGDGTDEESLLES